MKREEAAKKIIGREIYQFRNERGITRVKFMNELGNIPVSLPNIENGRSYPTLDFIVAVSNRYKISISEIIDTGFKKKRLNLEIENYPEQDLYYILQRVSLEKYSELRDREPREFVRVEMVDSNWSFMGNLLHNERVKRCCTYNQLGEKTGISIGTLKNIESGSNMSSFQTWYQICSSLKIPMDYFLVNRLAYKQGALVFLLQDIFEDITHDERSYLLQYMKLYGELYKKKKSQ